MPADLTLPLPAAELLPHRPPMLLLGRLLECQDGRGLAEAAFEPGGPFEEEDGGIRAVALVELLAQAYAAVKGYEDLLAGLPVKQGLLVGIRKAAFPGRAFAGDLLAVSVRRVGAIEGFILAEGEVKRRGQTLASATLKLWVSETVTRA